jgi:hypothetical protein
MENAPIVQGLNGLDTTLMTYIASCFNMFNSDLRMYVCEVRSIAQPRDDKMRETCRSGARLCFHDCSHSRLSPVVSAIEVAAGASMKKAGHNASLTL